MGSQSRSSATQIIGASIALLIIYAGSYLALMEHTVTFRFASSGMGNNALIWERVSSYKYGEEAAEVIFAPAVWFDKQIRPDYWVL